MSARMSGYSWHNGESWQIARAYSSNSPGSSANGTQRRGALGAAFGRNQINERDVLWHGLPTVPRWRITIHPELGAKVGRSGDRPIT